MRIAQVAPLFESVPPRLYGGTERIVSYLTEELVAMGHDVTLFASGDSITTAKLEPMARRSLRLDESCIDPIVHHVLMGERLAQRAGEFDVIHSHIDYFPFSVLRRSPTATVTTLHGNLGLDDLVPLYKEFADISLVSISDSQRRPLPWVNWKGTVYHGLPLNQYTPHEKEGEYLAFLGRISPEKRADLAIEVAKRAGLPLRIAAKVDRQDQEYFDAKVRPLLDHPLVEYIGEIGESEKSEFLGKAKALLFLIDWSEPFGLVMIEAMACGTPVITRRRGSVPEVIEDGVTGFLVETVAEATAAVERVGSLDRRKVRASFERRFTSERMAADYVRTYARLIAQNGKLRVA